MRRALTLFEILVALIVFLVAALSVVALLPAGFKAQHQARYKLYASAIAMSMMDNFHNPPLQLRGLGSYGTEGLAGDSWFQAENDNGFPRPGFADKFRSRPIYAQTYAPDFEQALNGMTTGLLPVPLEIAKRLDSEGGEIESLLADGGYLFFPDPAIVRTASLGGARGTGLSARPPPEYHRLVCAVVTSAQQNVLPVHPVENWPWYEQYPFPPQWALYIDGAVGNANARGYQPTFGPNMDEVLEFPALPPDPEAWRQQPDAGYSRPKGLQHGVTWHHQYLSCKRQGLTSDPWYTGWHSFRRLAGDPLSGWQKIMPQLNTEMGWQIVSLKDRLVFLDRALDLWQQVKPASITSLAPTMRAITSAETADVFPWSSTALKEWHYPNSELVKFLYVDPRTLAGADFPPHPAQIYALSYLAFAAMMVTGDRWPNIPPPNERLPLNADIQKGSIGLKDPITTQPFNAAEYRTFARVAHEMCMAWVMAYASENPQDWGAPRPANRPVMTDHPLVLWDMFHDAGDAASAFDTAVRTPKNVNLAGGPGSYRESFYRWVNARNMQDGGRKISNQPTFFLGFNQSGAPRNNFYGDGPNTSPSNASALPSHYQLLANHAQVAEPSAGYDNDRFWPGLGFAAEHRARELVFWAVDWQSYDDAESAPSAPIDAAKHARWFHYGDRWEPIQTNRIFVSFLVGNAENNYLWTDANRNHTWATDMVGVFGSNAGDFLAQYNATPDIQMGHWGADRNNNGKLDRGPVPRSTRMQAREVSRFVFYDPILRLSVKQ
ncbi:MAG: hypothetical protein H0W72_01810 [Planctomycetes bacterium]|nr:hypothetical protein [Planctomycetota bacterium]